MLKIYSQNPLRLTIIFFMLQLEPKLSLNSKEFQQQPQFADDPYYKFTMRSFKNYYKPMPP